MQILGRKEGLAELMSWLQHDRTSRVFYVGGAPLPVDVRGLVVSEGALIDSLHQAQASGALQAGANTRDHVRFIEILKEIRPAVLQLDYDYIERRTAFEK